MMGKLFCVCGTPGSGKTVTSVNLAKAIYRMTKGGRVIILSPDTVTPTVGYIFPNAKDEDMRSLGEIMEKAETDRDAFEKTLVSVKTMKNFALSGYKFGENRYTYPRPTEDKVSEIINAARELSDYLIVDCTCERGDMFSLFAKRECDAALQILTPDLRSVVSLYSTSDEYFIIEGKKIRILNITSDYPFLPVSEMKSCFRDIKAMLPFSDEIRKMEITGCLVEKNTDRAYLGEIEKLTGLLLSFRGEKEEEKEEETSADR